MSRSSARVRAQVRVRVRVRVQAVRVRVRVRVRDAHSRLVMAALPRHLKAATRRTTSRVMQE